MSGVDVDVDPADLAAASEAVQLVQATGLSHLEIAHSVWMDLYADTDDPSLQALGARSKRGLEGPEGAWDAFRAEWRDLACTDSPKYEELRAKVKGLRGGPATVVVSAIAAGLSAALGIAAGILVPFVAILLHGVVTVGNNVICRMMASRA